jgi:hypothetical protein
MVRLVDPGGTVYPIRVLATVAAALAALVLSAAPASAHHAATCPQAGTINGVSVLIECGPAKATMRFRGAPLKLKNGLCQRTSENFSLGFGAVLTAPSSKRPPDTFQLIAGGGSHPASRDGSYSATLQFTRSGSNYIGETMKLTLSHKRRAGTFSGTLTSTTSSKKLAVSGSFTC